MQVEVYLPVAVLIDLETGDIVQEPYVDWDGAPWTADYDVWAPQEAIGDRDQEQFGEEEEWNWTADRVWTDMAADALAGLLGHFRSPQ